MSWLNNDGLELKFGPEKTELNVLGEYRYDGPKRVLEIKFTYADLPAVADNSVLIRDNLSLPIGAIVEEVEIFCNVDFAMGAGTLNVGWIDTDRTNGVDVDAFVVEATQAELIAGGSNVAGWVGAGVGAAALTAPKLLTWEVNTAAVTAGEGYIRLYYSVA